MVTFDSHDKCVCCDKKVGDDPYVKGQARIICDGFSDAQCKLLLTPSYKICKERKAGTLVFPKDVTVISSIDLEGQASPQSTLQSSTHAPAASTSSASFVTSTQFEGMTDKLTEQFA